MSALHRDDGFDHQRRRDRPSDGTRSRRDLRLRQGYYHFGWWKKINATKAFFVTRVKVNTRLRKTKSRYVRKIIGDGFRIIADDNVVLASKGDSKLRSRCDASRSKRDKAGPSPSSPTISNAPQSRLRPLQGALAD